MNTPIEATDVDFRTQRAAKTLRRYVSQHHVDCCDFEAGLINGLDEVISLPVTN